MRTLGDYERLAAAAHGHIGAGQIPFCELQTNRYVRVVARESAGERRVCAECGEGIGFERHVIREARTLCRACAGERYYTPL